MTPDDKEFIIHFVLFWVIIFVIVIQWMFDWPSDQQLTYFTIGWFAVLCGTSLYRWHIDSKE